VKGRFAPFLWLKQNLKLYWSLPGGYKILHTKKQLISAKKEKMGEGRAFQAFLIAEFSCYLWWFGSVFVASFFTLTVIHVSFSYIGKITSDSSLNNIYERKGYKIY